MKQTQLEIRQLHEFVNENNIVEGYALKFNKPSKDLGGFIETIDARALDGVNMEDVKLFLNHDSGNLLGRTKSGTLQLSVDEVGLKFRCELPNTTLGNDVMELVKRGDLSQCSFGFTVAEDEWDGCALYHLLQSRGVDVVLDVEADACTIFVDEREPLPYATEEFHIPAEALEEFAGE